ncbi:MAG TPA: hypothetical protein VGD89_01850 [Flavipsychrobacter sp.]
MSRHLSLLVVLLAIAYNASADYRHMQLHEALDKADHIVIGKITLVGESYFQFAVDTVLKGNIRHSIKVKKFKNWTCASRYSDYKKGQEEILLLARNESGEYYPIGGGNEGEIPISQDSVYYGNNNWSLYESREYKVGDIDINGIACGKKQFIEAITYYIANRTELENRWRNDQSSKWKPIITRDKSMDIIINSLRRTQKIQKIK